jgi:hypothetical protein
MNNSIYKNMFQKKMSNENKEFQQCMKDNKASLLSEDEIFAAYKKCVKQQSVQKLPSPSNK